MTHRRARAMAAWFLLLPAVAAAGWAWAGDGAKPGKKAAERRAAAATSWGRRPGETAEAYKKRRGGMLKRCRKDELGMFAVTNLLFLVRTDISPEFTVNLALYTEELHRAYQEAFSRLGAPASGAKDIIEVVCYRDRARYVQEGGDENSGGHFHPAAKFDEKYWRRPPGWKAGQFRLVMFTNGVSDFERWEKTTMKHEAAHMELQFRLGYLVWDPPRWWNEGMAACFEWWDFSKSADENFAEIPRRGRYAPYIRRLWQTDEWKSFDYVWTIDGQSWHRDMATQQGMLNYCQAWSLAAFMFNQGREGKRFFNRIFNLAVSLGEDTKDARGVKKRGWEEAFPVEEREALEQAWVAWVKKSLPKDGRNPGEDLYLLQRGYDPDADRLVLLAPEQIGERLAKLKQDRKIKAARTAKPGKGKVKS